MSVSGKARFDLLLREGRINSMVTRNRIITGPMERSLANRDGSLDRAYVDYLAERALGGASLIVIESTYVDIRGLGHIYQVGLPRRPRDPGDSRRAADAVHAHGAKLGIELYVGGRQTPSVMSQRQPIAPSVVPCEVLSPVPVPRELTVPEIRDVVAELRRGGPPRRGRRSRHDPPPRRARLPARLVPLALQQPENRRVRGYPRESGSLPARGAARSQGGRRGRLPDRLPHVGGGVPRRRPDDRGHRRVRAAAGDAQAST